MIDELPVLAVIATQAEGIQKCRGAAELRVKETDRIATTVGELRRWARASRRCPTASWWKGQRACTART